MASPSRSPRTAWIWRLVPLLVLLLGLGIIFAFGLHRQVSFETLAAHRATLRDWVASHGAAAPVIYVVAYVAAVAFSVPGGVWLTLTGGFMFGPIWGACYAVVGATLGATGLFLAARTALGGLLRAKAGSALDRLRDGFRRDALSYLLVLRLVPIVPFFIVNLVPAFLGVTLRTYVVATFLGIIPATFVFASLGNGLGAVFDAGGRPDLGIIFTPPILLPLLGLAVLALIPAAYRYIQQRRNGVRN
ncbi:MAG: TVP38/TMEM64 family protein [Proteobacteria bacterium]|nr:TVP38/TMEM64 family protein [Pseudomonadota bacterium]